MITLAEFAKDGLPQMEQAAREAVRLAGVIADRHVQPPEDTSDMLRVEVRFKNARLYNAIAAQSVRVSNAPMAEALHRMGPVKAWADANGIRAEVVYQALNVSRDPYKRTYDNDGRELRTLKKPYQRIADLLGLHSAWLFPDDLYLVRWPSRLAVEGSPHHMLSLADVPVSQRLTSGGQHERIEQAERTAIVQNALKTLTPREEKVLAMRYGIGRYDREHTAEEIAKEFMLTRQSIYAIERKAIRKLQHPWRARALATVASV